MFVKFNVGDNVM